jgi:NAD(P)-dependent dehydrogenase (short-subunit alcohol dehydrogenase family)
MASHGIFDLTGKVAAIIGGASGIGEAVTLGAVAQGATVVCLDVAQDKAAAVAAQAGGTTESGVIDITDAASVDRALDGIVAKHGRLDIVICTPSINVRKKILDYTNEELDRVLKVNVSGNFNVLRTAGRIMVAQRRGSIVLFSSIRSLVVEPGQSVYSATKAGILQLARGPWRDRNAADGADQGQRRLVQRVRGQDDVQSLGQARGNGGTHAVPRF